jgi:arylsulfatase A
MLDFISRNKDEQFFCYYPMILTHSPFVPTPDSADPDCKDKQKNFEDMVAYTDKIVGKIVGHLKKLGLLENTVILFTGDNGTGRGIVSKLNGKVYPGAKGQMSSDAGPHVPFVAYWPAGGVTGAVLDDPIDFSDFLPTIAELGQAPLPKGVTIDGASFAGRLRGDYGGERRKRRNPTVCARGRRYHLIGDGNMYDFLEDPLFANPIPAEKAKQERAKLQAVIDRMEIQRAKSDEVIAKGRYIETIDPALTRDAGKKGGRKNNKRKNPRKRKMSKKQRR